MIVAVPQGVMSDEGLIAWVHETFNRLLPGALGEVRIERYPSERFVVVSVAAKQKTGARSIAQLLRSELSRRK